MIFKGPDEQTFFKDLPETSVLKLIVKYLQKNGTKLAFMSCNAVNLTRRTEATWKQVLKWSSSIASELNRRGVTAGDLVLFVCDDKSVSAYCLLLGAMLAGATAAPVAFDHFEEHFQLFDQTMRVKWVFYDHSMVEDIEPLMKTWSSQTKHMGVDAAMDTLANTNNSFVFEVKDVKKHIPLMLFTSASFAQILKLVKISDSALKGYGQKGLYERRMTEFGPFLLASSFYWNAGFTVLMASIFHGFALYFTNERYYVNHLDTLIKHKIKSCLLMSSDVSLYPKFMTVDHPNGIFPSLRHVWITGGLTGSATKELFMKRILESKTDVQDVYGTAEIGLVTTWENRCVPGICDTGSVGYLKSGVECKVKNEKGELLSTHEEGQLWFKSYAQFTAYWEHPGLTASALDKDGFFNTGDVGYFDDEGLLYIAGKGDLTFSFVNTPLARIAIIQDFLRSRDTVLEAFVIFTEMDGIIAFIVFKEDFILPMDDLMDLFEATALIMYINKKNIHVRKHIPVTPDGKPSAFLLLNSLEDEECDPDQESSKKMIPS